MLHAKFICSRIKLYTYTQFEGVNFVKDSKGITMASLVVMIASIILLSTMAISFGYRYLTETKKRMRNILKKFYLVQ